MGCYGGVIRCDKRRTEYKTSVPDLGFWDRIMDIVDDMKSDDVMDRCEVVNVEVLKTNCAVDGMEDLVIEEIYESELWDEVFPVEQIAEILKGGRR